MNPTDDRIIVSEIDVDYLDENNVRIETILRNVMTIIAVATYVVQVTDEENAMVYLNWTDVAIHSGHVAFMYDYLLDWGKGSYTIKVFAWYPIEGEVVEPLLMEPKTRLHVI